MIERVAVISLARRQDRRDAFRLPKDWPWPEPSWFRAIDGSGLDLPPAWARAGSGAYGCALSHVAVLEQALADGIWSLLVLEDDAVFCEEFTARLQEFKERVPDDWAMVMLGGQHVHGVPIMPIVRCRNTQRTHAYAIRGPAIRLLADLFRSTAEHIDRALPIFQAQAPTYAPRPFLVSQAAGRSDVDGFVSAERSWN